MLKYVMEIGLIPKSITKIRVFQIPTKFFANFLPIFCTPIMLKSSAKCLHMLKCLSVKKLYKMFTYVKK